MNTRLIKLGRGASGDKAVKEAAEVLRAGGLVGFPTDTVYGIAANAADAGALKKLRSLKDRPQGQPFTLVIADKKQTSSYVGELGWPAAGLVRKGWPGPLTLIFQVPKSLLTDGKHPVAAKAREVYHRGTIGIRCPDHQGARKLLREAGCPVVAPSANRRGQPPAARAEDVVAELDGKLDLILDGGRCRYDQPSTIVQVKPGQYKILRPGVLDERIIAGLARMRVMFVCSGNSCRSPMAQGLFKMKLALRLGCEVEELAGRGFEVVSSGTMGITGAPATTNAIRAVGELGANIRGHLSKGLDREGILQSDYIFTMTQGHLNEVLRLAPAAKNKTKCLDPSGDISDPIGLDLGGYRACAARLAKAVDGRLKEIKI